jgi:hypothetical protein
MNKISRNTHTGKSAAERNAYLSRLKTPRAADPTLQEDQDDFTVSPKENESNINREVTITHRKYNPPKQKNSFDLSMLRIIAECVVGLMVLIMFLVAITLNREVGEHSVKLDVAKDKISDIEKHIDKQDIKIDKLEANYNSSNSNSIKSK